MVSATSRLARGDVPFQRLEALLRFAGPCPSTRAADFDDAVAHGGDGDEPVLRRRDRDVAVLPVSNRFGGAVRRMAAPSAFANHDEPAVVENFKA